MREYVQHTPKHRNEELADALREKGIRYAVANFWLAYDVTWLTNEEIIIRNVSPADKNASTEP